MSIKRYIVGIVVTVCLMLPVTANYYAGRVVDEKGQPIPFATVYPEQKPELGTATTNEGCFSFKADLASQDRIIISFIGYEKQVIPAQELVSNPLSSRYEGRVIVLKEQPISLEETVITAKPSRQRNKRKQLATLLHSVYMQIEKDFPNEPVQYELVSDVAMQSGQSSEQEDSHSAIWGMEQMIATIVVLPESAHDGRDSVQFQGRFCKRFFNAEKRAQADEILSGQTLERLEKDAKMPHNAPKNLMRRAANSIDSGVVVHRALFGISDMRFDFQENMNDLKHWSVSNESEKETVLTYTQKKSKYLGFFRMIYKRHYIVDSQTYAVRRFSEHAEVRVTIPFGYKLNADQLQLLNLLNMGEEQLQKFRMRKLRASVDLNTLFQRVDGRVYVKEKNMQINAHFVGSRNKEVPIHLKATQHVTGLHTKDIQPLRRDQITRRMERQIVEIY